MRTIDTLVYTRTETSAPLHFKSFIARKMVFGKFAKQISKALSPKNISKAARKTVPKVLTGGAFLGAGIAAEKLATMNEEDPMLTAQAPDDSNLIDQSYTLIKV